MTWPRFAQNFRLFYRQDNMTRSGVISACTTSSSISDRHVHTLDQSRSRYQAFHSDCGAETDTAFLELAICFLQEPGKI